MAGAAAAGGRVEAIFLAPTAGAAMREVEAVHAIAGRGLEGDRYGEQQGHWASDPCEVTLIAAETLDLVVAQTGLALHGGQHRRNLVTRGVELTPEAGPVLWVGEARLRVRKPRPPCAHLERLSQPRMRTALGHHAGVCADILVSGRIHSSAEITLG